MLHFSASPQAPAVCRRNCSAVCCITLRKPYTLMETMCYTDSLEAGWACATRSASRCRPDTRLYNDIPPYHVHRLSTRSHMLQTCCTDCKTCSFIHFTSSDSCAHLFNTNTYKQAVKLSTHLAAELVWHKTVLISRNTTCLLPLVGPCCLLHLKHTTMFFLVLPRDAMHSADYAAARCLSICHVPVFCRNG